MQDLKVIENELVPVYETDTGEKVVNGRELHAFIESKQDFSDWVKKRVLDCDAAKEKDFTIILWKSDGGRPSKEYIIKLDTAKEMAMLERNDKGKEVRRYFIDVEKRYQLQVVDVKNSTPTDPNTIPEDRLKALELIVNCPEHAIDLAKGIVKPFMFEPEPTTVLHKIEEPAGKSIHAFDESRYAIAYEEKQSLNTTGKRTPFDAKKLRKHLVEIGMTQKELSRLSGVAAGVLSNALTGESTPGFAARDKWCEALSKPTGWLDAKVKSMPLGKTNNAESKNGMSFNYKKLERHLRKINMSYSELARRAGVGISTISNCIKGVSRPTDNNRYKICKALNQRKNWLDGGAEQ